MTAILVPADVFVAARQKELRHRKRTTLDKRKFVAALVALLLDFYTADEVIKAVEAAKAKRDG